MFFDLSEHQNAPGIGVLVPRAPHQTVLLPAAYFFIWLWVVVPFGFLGGKFDGCPLDSTEEKYEIPRIESAQKNRRHLTSIWPPPPPLISCDYLLYSASSLPLSASASATTPRAREGAPHGMAAIIKADKNRVANSSDMEYEASLVR